MGKRCVDIIEPRLERKDIINFLDLIDSQYSPNYKPQIGRMKPYWKLLKKENMDETEYKSFLYIYSHLKDILSERERFILDSIYGVSGEFLNDTQVAKILNISNSRVGQIRRKAERKLGKKLLELYDEVI
ncbi:hypothetical protein X953_01665 [Virgibacillus sp. SK37]|nr:hypothetical protein X953_01665 [Virgibacillus sp. SK37]